MTDDTLWRIYSMTKPVTSVAAMMLYEEGAFELKDPVAKFIPSFADARVWAGGSQQKPVTVRAREPVRMWHLLTHTSGLAYGFPYAHPVDGIYRDRGFEFGCRRAWTSSRRRRVGGDAAAVRARAPSSTTASPPTCSGGGRGALRAVARRVLQRAHPRAARDARHGVQRARPRPDGRALRRPGWCATTRSARARCARPTFLSGGGGLISTAADYHRFTSMLVGGEGAPLLGPVRCATWPATTCPAGPS